MVQPDAAGRTDAVPVAHDRRGNGYLYVSPQGSESVFGVATQTRSHDLVASDVAGVDFVDLDSRGDSVYYAVRYSDGAATCLVYGYAYNDELADHTDCSSITSDPSVRLSTNGEVVGDRLYFKTESPELDWEQRSLIRFMSLRDGSVDSTTWRGSKLSNALGRLSFIDSELASPRFGDLYVEGLGHFELSDVHPNGTLYSSVTFAGDADGVAFSVLTYRDGVHTVSILEPNADGGLDVVHSWDSGGYFYVYDALRCGDTYKVAGSDSSMPANAALITLGSPTSVRTWAGFEIARLEYGPRRRLHLTNTATLRASALDLDC